MGIFKRMLRRTSNRLLCKLGGQRNSRQLVLNSMSAQQQIAYERANLLCSTNANKLSSAAANRLQRRQTSSKRNNGKINPIRQAKRASKSQIIPEALLQAAKNHLPPVQFHHVHGPFAHLSKNKFVASRTQSFCQALVFSNRIILPNERVYIKVLEIAKGWSGTIRFGFTSVDPATLRYKMPKHACPDMTNAGHTWARALADEVVRRNSVIHFSYNTNGFIHYGINNQDCGIFCANVNTSQHLWFVVDVYGLTAAVELIDPRVHNAAMPHFSRLSDGEYDHDDEEDVNESLMRGPHSEATRFFARADGSPTMFKSTNGMDNLLAEIYGLPPGSNIRGGSKKKRIRKLAARYATDPAALYDRWAPEGVFMSNSSPMGRHQNRNLQFQQQHPNFLPNLSSILLPATQQNIYSPMPAFTTGAGLPASLQRENPTTGGESHNYHQIMNNQARIGKPQHAMRAAAERPNVSSSMYESSSAINGPLRTSGITTSALDTSNSSSETTSGLARAAAASRIDEQEMSHQMGSLQITDSNSNATHRQQHASSSRSPLKSTNPTLPVAAARRGQQNNPLPINPKRDSNDSNKITHAVVNDSSSPASSSKTAKTHQAIKPRARQSIKTAKSTPSAVAGQQSDKNNNDNPPSRDCPICFERPINCVLYQCGHMCTCYECGVKQWRTQSRTCPICRTVIKDVIKTYMS